MPSEGSISKSPKSVGSFSIPILRLPVGFDSMINSMFWVLEMKGERDECGSNGKLCGDCGHLLSAAGMVRWGCYPPIQRSYLDNLPVPPPNFQVSSLANKQPSPCIQFFDSFRSLS